MGYIRTHSSERNRPTIVVNQIVRFTDISIVVVHLTRSCEISFILNVVLL